MKEHRESDATFGFRSSCSAQRISSSGNSGKVNLGIDAVFGCYAGIVQYRCRVLRVTLWSAYANNVGNSRSHNALYLVPDLVPNLVPNRVPNV